MLKKSFENRGIGVLVLIIVFSLNSCREQKTKESRQFSINSSVKTQNSQSQVVIEEQKIPKEDEEYLTNSLVTGATPYLKYYGENYHCPDFQCSGIRITAPVESDIVVIIKLNNKNGKVVQHGYIRAGDTYQFDVPDGTYQTFFYYGEGWNPNKEYPNGVRGGFIRNEIFSKDEPQQVNSAVLNYVLQLQYDGNFQTRDSNPVEVF